MTHTPDDRRYMTFEQRAQDDPKYRNDPRAKKVASEHTRAKYNEARLAALRARKTGDAEAYEAALADVRFWRARLDG